MMTRRLRIAHVIVQPVLVWDDGDELSPGPPTQPRAIPLSELATAADAFKAELPTVESAVLAQEQAEPGTGT